MSETDEQFVERMTPFHGIKSTDSVRLPGDDFARLFALARRGAAAADRIAQLEAALRDILSKSCDAFYEMANMLDDEDFSGEVPGRSGTLIGHREEYHRYMVEVLTKAGDAAREALTAMEQRT